MPCHVGCPQKHASTSAAARSPAVRPGNANVPASPPVKRTAKAKRLQKLRPGPKPALSRSRQHRSNGPMTTDDHTGATAGRLHAQTKRSLKSRQPQQQKPAKNGLTTRTAWTALKGRPTRSNSSSVAHASPSGLSEAAVPAKPKLSHKARGKRPYRPAPLSSPAARARSQPQQQQQVRRPTRSSGWAVAGAPIAGSGVAMPAGSPAKRKGRPGTAASGACRCGSTVHFRTSHSECPLNPANLLAKSDKETSSEVRVSTRGLESGHLI